MTSDGFDPTLEDRFAGIQQALNHRWPEDRIEPTLDRVSRAVELLGDPQSSYPSIHVAGTNAKTSTVRLIDRLALSVGLRTGRFTSPHLENVRERIALSGEPIDIARFAETYDDVSPYIEMVDAESIGRGGPAMSTFEVLTVLALAAFAEAPVDAAVIEVGMGGTWDATNVVDAQVAVITPIGMEQQEINAVGAQAAETALDAGADGDGGEVKAGCAVAPVGRFIKLFPGLGGDDPVLASAKPAVLVHERAQAFLARAIGRRGVEKIDVQLRGGAQKLRSSRIIRKGGCGRTMLEAADATELHRAKADDAHVQAG